MRSVNDQAFASADRSERRTADRWEDDKDCEVANVKACDPVSDDTYHLADAPAICAQWDFMSGQYPSSIRVPAVYNGAAGADTWQIFETGDAMIEQRGF